MAASTSGALKAYLEAQSLGIAVYQDKSPKTVLGFSDPTNKTPTPFLIVFEGFPILPDKLEDGQIATVRETVQIDVWLPLRNMETGARLEDPTLAGKVAKALGGSRLLTSGTGVPPTTVYGVLVSQIGPRQVTEADNTVRVPLTVDIFRAL